MLEKETIINKVKIRYIYNKDISGDDVFVFLHGWGSSFKAFDSLYNELNINYFALDFPGFGKSSKLDRIWNLSDYVNITKIFIEKMVPNKNIIFVCHSFGGRVLLKLLYKYKIEHIKRVICIGVPFIRKFGLREKIIYFITKFFKNILFFVPKTIKNKLKKIWHVVIRVDDYGDLNNDIMKKTFINIVNEDVFKYSTALKKYETYFIWGQRDKIASLKDAKYVSQKTGAKLYVISKGSHFPFVTPTEKEFRSIFREINNL